MVDLQHAAMCNVLKQATSNGPKDRRELGHAVQRIGAGAAQR